MIPIDLQVLLIGASANLGPIRSPALKRIGTSGRIQLGRADHSAQLPVRPRGEVLPDVADAHAAIDSPLVAQFSLSVLVLQLSAESQDLDAAVVLSRKSRTALKDNSRHAPEIVWDAPCERVVIPFRKDTVMGETMGKRVQARGRIGDGFHSSNYRCTPEPFVDC